MASPRQLPRSFGTLAAGLVAAALAGCADSGAGGGSGSGGTSPGGSTARGGTGGSTGGVTGSSGVTGTGGTPATGGVTSSGGAPSTGGSPGTGGSNGSGGNATGGALGTGGSSGGSAGVGGNGNGGTTAGGAGTGGTPATGGSAGGAGASSAGSAGAAGMASTCPPAAPLSGGMQYCENTTGNAGGGYSYELWAEGPGSGCMTVRGVDANFSATWDGVEDFLARVGLGFDRTRTHSQIGTISAEFAETKTGNNGLVYVGIYGWTVEPLREYYILDDWGDTKPAGIASDGTPRTSVGTIVVDGETYDVWMKTRENKPAITGDNMTFDQYFSIRRTARQCGRISVSEHFSKWIELGLELGNLVETKILIEAQDSTGTIDFTTATVVVD